MASYKQNEKLSLLICLTLDNFGFKKEMVASRRKFLEELARKPVLQMKNYGFELTVEMAGSCGEGIQMSGSDVDVMLVIENTVCVDNGGDDGKLVVLQADYTNTAPGYTRVASVNMTDCTPLKTIVFFFEKFYLSETGSPYLSSVNVRNNLGTVIGSDCFCKQNGPAVTSYSKCQKYDIPIECDFVFSIYYYGNDILQKWAKRKRSYAWPSRKTIKEISEMEGYIVPVGDKLSENQIIEWRICFTTAEKKLVSILDNVQIKLYILLKLFTKRIFKPLCPEITSYIVKNVVFWILETTCQGQSSGKCLVYLFLKSLSFIKQCLQNSYLPNYMIPERNLWRGVDFGKRKNAVINFLSDCLQQGGSIILRIPNLKRCISLFCTNPKLVVKYCKWSEEGKRLEHRFYLHALDHVGIYFVFYKTLEGCLTECLKKNKYSEETIRYLDHVVPNWRRLNTDEIIHCVLSFKSLTKIV